MNAKAQAEILLWATVLLALAGYLTWSVRLAEAAAVTATLAARILYVSR